MFLFQLRGNGKRLQGEPEICLAFFGTPALSLNTLKLQNGEWLLLIFNAYFINPCHNFVGQVELPLLSHQSTTHLRLEFVSSALRIRNVGLATAILWLMATPPSGKLFI